MPISPGRASAFDILLRVQQQDAYAAELLHSDRLDKLSTADRGLAMEIVMGVLRWQSRLDSAIAASSSRPIAKLDAQVLIALRMATYQLMFLTRVPARAAINDSVDLVKRAGKTSAAPFANAVLRKLSDSAKAVTDSSPAGLTVSELAEAYAHPAWLVARWAEQFGIEKAAAICRHDQQIPATSIRADDDAVIAELEAEGITLAPGALLDFGANSSPAGDVTPNPRVPRRAGVHPGRSISACGRTGGQRVAFAGLLRRPRQQDCGHCGAQSCRPKSSRSSFIPIAPNCCERRVRATNVQVITARHPANCYAGRIRSRAGRCPLLRHGHAGAQSGNQVAAQASKTYATCTPSKSRFCGPRYSSSRRAGERFIRRARSNRKRIKLWWTKCLTEMRNSHSLIVVLELERLRKDGELASNQLDSLLDGQYLRTIPGVHPCDGFFAAVLQRLS